MAELFPVSHKLNHTVGHSIHGQCQFYNAQYRQCQFYNAQYRQCQFYNAQYRQCQFYNAQYRQCQFYNAQYRQCQFHNRRVWDEAIKVCIQLDDNSFYMYITGIILKRFISFLHILFNYIFQNRILSSHELIRPSMFKIKEKWSWNGIYNVALLQNGVCQDLLLPIW